MNIKMVDRDFVKSRLKDVIEEINIRIQLQEDNPDGRVNEDSLKARPTENAMDFFYSNIGNKHLLYILKDIAMNDLSQEIKEEALNMISDFYNSLLQQLKEDLLKEDQDETHKSMIYHVDRAIMRNRLVNPKEDDKCYFEDNIDNRDALYMLRDIALDDYSDDARMNASYYISKFEEDLLREIEEDLLKLQQDEWHSVADHAIVALSRIKSKRGLEYLIYNRIQPELYWASIALENYLLR